MSSVGETINWSEQLEAARHPGGEFQGVGLYEFIEQAKDRFEQLYISDEVVERVEAADCKIHGVRYFNGLFSPDNLRPQQRLESIFIGSVAQGAPEYALESYRWLLGQAFVNSDELNLHLLGVIDKALAVERSQGKCNRIENLESAAKALGKPLIKRLAGTFATQAAIRRGSLG
jgi:hypothetical protein